MTRIGSNNSLACQQNGRFCVKFTMLARRLHPGRSCTSRTVIRIHGQRPVYTKLVDDFRKIERTRRRNEFEQTVRVPVIPVVIVSVEFDQRARSRKQLVPFPWPANRFERVQAARDSGSTRGNPSMPGPVRQSIAEEKRSRRERCTPVDKQPRTSTINLVFPLFRPLPLAKLKFDSTAERDQFRVPQDSLRA